MRMDELKDIMGVDAKDIVRESFDLLTAREWDGVTEEGIAANLETSLYMKNPKLMRFKENPWYNGNLQLVMPIKVKRDVSFSSAKRCLNSMIDNMFDEPKSATPEGKYPSDFIEEMAGSKVISFDEIKNGYTKAIISKLHEEFDGDLCSRRTQTLIDKMIHAIDIVKNNIDERISVEQAEALNEWFELDKKKFIAGQKTSKVVKRILDMSNNYMEYYNDLFTTFGNAINQYESDGYFVVSLNFLDYLRMSDGVSWSSCQTTDYHNTRHMSNHYHGAYVQGCLSYANDGVSMVTYVIDAKGADPNHPDRTYKINRCMFHVSDDFKQIIQGRVYPNGRDDSSCTNVYDTYFDNFLKIMGLNKSDYYLVGRADENCNVRDCGSNYRDYYEYSDPRLFLANGKSNDIMKIGNIGYSCADGDELDTDLHHTII